MNYFQNRFKTFFETENSRMNLLLPIAFALGIIIYFVLPFEPNLYLSFGVIVVCITAFFYLKSKSNIALLFLGLVFFGTGFFRIALESQLVKAPFIHKTYAFVSVSGRVEKMEWQQSGIRLTLSPVSVDKIPLQDYPKKVRIRINGQKVIPEVGDLVSVRATLSPPSLPFIPNGYSFARKAYFDQIGAVGFATGKLRVHTEKSKSPSFIENIRSVILERILSLLPKDEGNIAVALVTGEQGGVSKTTRENYTASGIVHVLSVSGFHMSLIAAFIFGILRFLFSLFPTLSLRYNTKKICAVLALIITFFYLLISGMAIPAVRSFLMIAFVLTAVIFDRQALSMRSVMWAGLLILLICPDTIMTASFTLSFAAVIALIAGYESVFPLFSNYFHRKPAWIKYTLGTFCFFIIMNFIAHAATSPIALYHFHRYPNYALLGNFLTSTLFSIFIMPLLFIGTILIPLKLDALFFILAGYLLKLINFITEWIAGLPYATLFAPSFPDWGYALILIGGLWLCIWKSKVRYFGILAITIGFASVFTYRSPDMFVGQGGRLIAVRQENTYAFNTLTKQKTVRRVWIESTGQNPNLPVFKIDGDIVNVKGLTVDITGNSATPADIVLNNSSKTPCSARLLCLSRAKLWKEGVHTLYINSKNVDVEYAAANARARPWHQGDFKAWAPHKFLPKNRPDSRKAANTPLSDYPTTKQVGSSESDKSNNSP